MTGHRPDTGNGAEPEDLLRAAARAVTALNAELATTRRRWKEPVAVVGMALRMPGGADSAESFWRLLADGRDATCEFPADRGDARALLDSDPDVPGRAYVTRGGYLHGDVAAFEPEVFGISPREATGMDPQQRMVLEMSWEALENAGYAPDRLAGSATGVYVGVSTTDYVRMRQAYGDIRDTDAYQLMGEPSFVAGRVSFALGLRGPSQVVDTACSSSLVALHDACRALRRGDCDSAVAGGVNLLLMPFGFVLMSKFRALAPDGRCKTFDAGADGYARGEGGAMVVLKRLADAEADGDTVLGVIRGSAVNHDGRSSGISVPNPRAQQDVIRDALADGDVDPAEVCYVEAHGTGTALGDPIELGALDAVLGAGRPVPAAPTAAPAAAEDDGSVGPLLVGSVKTNIGHLEAGAGAAGLAKLLLAMRHDALPAHLHLTEPNPRAPWDRLRLCVPTATVPWPATSPRVAGLSSFGVTGTNAHVVVAAATQRGSRPAEPGPDVLLLSARTDSSLRSAAHSWAVALEDDPRLWHDFCWTSQIGRARHGEGLVVAAADAADAVRNLRGWLDGGHSTAVRTRAAGFPGRDLTLLFTGQGAQFAGMAVELLDMPLLAGVWRELDAAFTPLLGVDPEAVLAGRGVDLDDTRWTQPALFMAEYVVVRALTAVGIEPDLLLGHSIGEIVAATAAGVLSLPDAARLVVARAALMAELPRDSGMLAVSAPEPAVRELLADVGDQVAVAAVNGPADTVVSGFRAALDVVARRCRDAGHPCTALNVSHGFHSPAMDPALARIAELERTVKLGEPTIPLLSNVTGGSWDECAPEAGYWSRHARSAVRFSAGMEVAGATTGTFVEVGPHPVLTSLGRRCLPEHDAAWLAVGRRGRDARLGLLSVLGVLHLGGTEVDWDTARGGEPRQRVPAPGYAWERRSFWFGTSGSAVAGPPDSAAPTNAVGGGRPDPVLGVPVAPGRWVRSGAVPVRPGGRLGLETVVPGVLRAARLAGQAQPGRWRVRDVTLGPVDEPAAIRWRTRDGDGCQLSADVADAGADPTGEVGWVRAASAAAVTETSSVPWAVPAGPVTGSALVVLPEGTAPWAAVAAAVEDVLDEIGDPGRPHVLTVGTMRLDPARLAAAPGSVRCHGDPDADGAVVLALDADEQVVGELTGVRRYAAPRAALVSPRTVLHRVVWGDDPRPDTPSVEGPVVVTGERGTADDVVAALRQRGLTVTDLRRDDGHVEVADVLGRLADLDGPSAVPDGVQVIVVAPGADDVRRVLDLELELCRLVVALDEAGAGARVRVLTWSSVRALPSDEVPGRAGRTLWGLGRVAALEHPRSWAGLVDSCAGADPATTAAALCARSDEDEIAVRGKDRPRTLVPRLTAAGGDLPGSYRPLDPAGTVLVSGAFGGIGQRVVRWLRDAGVRSFLLVSRRGAAAPGCGELVDELTADGCEVTVAPADVTDATALRAAVRDVAARGGRLTGVVHAAGCSAPQNMVDVDAATYRSVWEPKVLGALALEEATEGCELQLFLCFSSVAATWGSQHLASYAAANAFLDAVCERRRAVGLAGVSMSWGPWDVPSELFGADVLEFLQSVGLRVLDPALCVDLLDRLATGDEPHWVVCAADWPRYRDVMGARRNRPLLDRVGASTALPGQGSGPAGGLLASVGDPGRSRQDRLAAAADFLGGQVAGALGIEPGALQATANVFAVGLDSLMVMEVCSACRAAGVEVAPRELFERSTVAEWAEFLVATLDGGAEQAEGLAASMEDPAVLEPLCTLPADLAEHVEPGPATAAAPRRVLLTGATGFVGSHVLHELLARPGVQVECLVRAASDDEALNRVVAALRARGLSTGTDRVSALAADLAAPRCGLSEAGWAALADRTEVVVHNAAVVDFVHSFEQLRAVNVDATLELLRLARTGGNVPFHFVSTYGVWGLPEGDGLRVAEDGDLRAAGRLVTGYTQTKWVADRMVGRAREAGQHAAVHRLGRVVCDSAGRSAMTEHFTSRVLKACVDLGVAPELDVELEITPADYVGRALAALATSPGSTGRDYHLVSDSRMPFLDAVTQLKRAGYRIEVVDRHEWWELLTADVEGRGSALRPVLDAVQRLIIEGEHALDLDATHARRRLDPLGIRCPALDESLLGALVARFRQEGFLPEPTLASTA